MKDSQKPETILFAEFEAYRDVYESFIPSELRELDDIRLDKIPRLLQQRKTEGDAFLERTELSHLMDWKLYVDCNILGGGFFRSAPYDAIVSDVFCSMSLASMASFGPI